MVQIENIMDAISAKLAGAFPYAVYEDDVPQDFTRPSFLVKITSMEATDHTRWTEWIIVTAKITAFEVANEYGNVPQGALLRLQRRARSLFTPGLAVGDRVLHVKPAQGKTGLADAEITLTITYADDRDEKQTYPEMENIKTKLGVEEEIL